uniref:Uncharacterized protein n=2 Tax=Anguilla anguilla TaxID=7936 RepID=A0A0E9VAG2_ANGAN
MMKQLCSDSASRLLLQNYIFPNHMNPRVLNYEELLKIISFLPSVFHWEYCM